MAKLTTAERKAFYLQKMEEHRHLLRSAVGAMGRRDLIQALPAATSIRVLVHETGHSVPILKHLRADYLALTVRVQVPPRIENFSQFANPMTIMHLPFPVRISGAEPRLSLNPSPDMSSHISCGLGEWWTRPVLKVPGCEPLSRGEVVLGVANKEGAHADDDMTENYRRVLQSEPLKFTDGTADLEPINVTRFAVGAAAIELLDMLDRTFPVKEESPA